MTGSIDIIPGWSETVCIFCTNLIEIDDIEIIQSPNPCLTSLARNSYPEPESPKQIAYSGVDMVNTVATWSNFFTNSDTDICPMTTCLVMEQGCNSEYSGNFLFVSSLEINARADV